MAIRKKPPEGTVPPDPETEIPETFTDMGTEIPEESSRRTDNLPEPIQPRHTIVEEDVVFISIGKELKDHYDITLATRDEVLADYEATGNAKAAILNATAAAIRDLAKLQLEIYNSDTIARIQQAIINALQEASPELKDKVVNLIEKHLERV